jgi:hypothetical protein
MLSEGNAAHSKFLGRVTPSADNNGAPNNNYYLQRAFTPDWMGSIAL